MVLTIDNQSQGVTKMGMQTKRITKDAFDLSKENPTVETKACFIVNINAVKWINEWVNEDPKEVAQDA